ncbi:hypothetical protein [Acetobacter okinawensis]|nr:hypothetical protein [Acetobacter okinawensis]
MTVSDKLLDIYEQDGMKLEQLKPFPSAMTMPAGTGLGHRIPEP